MRTALLPHQERAVAWMAAVESCEVIWTATMDFSGASIQILQLTWRAGEVAGPERVLLKVVDASEALKTVAAHCLALTSLDVASSNKPTEEMLKAAAGHCPRAQGMNWGRQTCQGISGTRRPFGSGNCVASNPVGPHEAVAAAIM